MLLNQLLERRDSKANTVRRRLITTHVLILLLCKTRRKSHSEFLEAIQFATPTYVVLAVWYFYHVFQREWSHNTVATGPGCNGDHRALLPAANILLAAI